MYHFCGNTLIGTIFVLQLETLFAINALNALSVFFLPIEICAHLDIDLNPPMLSIGWILSNSTTQMIMMMKYHFYEMKISANLCNHSALPRR